MEGIVEVVVSSLLNSVSQILVRETNLILNARDQFQSFQGELRFIHEFLRNSAGERDKVKEFQSFQGLPLAIVVAAGLLRNREESMWSKVASGLNWYLAQGPTECLDILALSYDDLPPHLKPCFLYFGAYPEDFDIPVRQLIRLWVAEGFVDQEINDNLDMEDMAEEYLYQLIDRSLIQVARRRTDGGVKSCRIHDLLRDLSISEGKRVMFLEVHKNIDTPLPATNKPIRRLSVHYGSRDIRYNYLSVYKFSRLRSLLSFGDYSSKKLALDKDPFSRVPKFCRYLRVLDLGSARYYNFPPKVEKLEQLRYLRINALNLDGIPLPISKLPNLQVLDVEDSDVFYFNVNLSEMQQLRHLILCWQYTKFHIPSALPNLRTLSPLFLSGEDDVDILKRLSTLFPNLKKLTVRCCKDDFDVEVFEYLSKLQRLQTLKILGNFRWMNPGALLLSLTKITLKDTRLPTSAFSQLGGIPNLQVLKLRRNSLYGRKLEYHSNQGLFPRLEVLHIRHLNNVELWSMEGQGLQSLVYLSIVGCGNLKAIPDQLKQLSTLRQLKVKACPLRQIWVNDARFEYIPNDPFF